MNILKTLTFMYSKGRHGAKISELQLESKAHIKVTRETTDADETIVKIFGDATAIEKAKHLIDGLTKDHVKVVPTENVQVFNEEKHHQPIDWQLVFKQCVSF